MEETLYQKQQDKKLEMLVGLVVTLVLSSLLYVEYGNIK